MYSKLKETNKPKLSVEKTRNPKVKNASKSSNTNKYVKQPQIQNPNGGNNSQIESPKSKIFYQMESK
jgi:hypothetical protein